jgi:hypothetical protein
MNNSTVAHNFAHNSQTGKNGSNLFYEHNSNGSRTIYSYGYHFGIAHIPNAQSNTVYFTMASYSNTTAKHISHIWRAVSHMNIVYCPLDITEYFRFGKPTKKGIKRSLEWFERQIAETVSKHINARKYSYLPELVGLLSNLRAFSNAFKCKHLLTGKARQAIYKGYNTEQIEALYFSPYQIEAHKQRQRNEVERLKKKEAKQIKAFKAFERDYLNTSATYLRLNGETIETSKGIKYTNLDEAKVLFTIAQTCKQMGKPFEKHLRIMQYTLNKVTENGTIKIGCHTIPYKETETIAKKLKWI